MWWVIWILAMLAVIAAQFLTTRTLLRTRRSVAEMGKRVARARQEEKIARNNLEMAKRLLSEMGTEIARQRDANEKLTETIAALDLEREKKMQEMKKKLTL